MKKIQKGDEVKILRGRFNGKIGEVIKSLEDDYIQVKGCNLKKHVKPTETTDGGILDRPAKIHVSNVMMVSGKNKIARVKFDLTDKNKKRVY